ncbi:uncharacterized protein G2W53_044581 [Senna tora]|uniref:Uncharacterized protein n=1 Tax=Senna tora TaxID=362788 RepID=A0A834SDJ4_9FABA|nr:uncharacterized protein G2W53_044581 [Senna tora]
MNLLVLDQHLISELDITQKEEAVAQRVPLASQNLIDLS